MDEAESMKMDGYSQERRLYSGVINYTGTSKYLENHQTLLQQTIEERNWMQRGERKWKNRCEKLGNYSST